jgi:hypothetical protein
MFLASLASAETWIVKDGKAQAEIIVSPKPTRTAKLAASELQRFIERISGAKLPLVNESTDSFPVKIYVGRSAGTDSLKLSDDGLLYGAFHIVSGENWMAFLGDDVDYVPPEPWPRNPSDKQEVAKVTAEWDVKTGAKWGNPLMSTHRLYSPLLDIWATDGRGSINAVYHFLKTLGVRWYYPDETGLIVPTMKSIALPKIDMVSKPDFPMRDMLVYYNEFFHARPGVEEMGDRIKWQLWLGLNSDVNVLGHTQGHGTMVVICRDEMKKEHPDYYALYNGKRAINFDGYGAPCLSSEGLFEENVKFIRAAYDICKEPMFSVSPSDSYSLCGCELCKGKDTPARGFRGQLSDYVWMYLDRVSRELYKTHPDRKIQGIAYCPYQLPPEKVKTFSPNVVVGVCQWRSLFYDKTERDYFLKLRKDWLEKLPSKTLFTWDYYLHGWENRSQWVHVPTFFPRLIAEDLKSLKGISLGDHTDIGNTNADRLEAFGDAMSVNHLNAYVTAACLWNADTDIDALLEEYYNVYYGSAAPQMKAFIEYSENNWMKASKDSKVIDKFFELIAAAKKTAGDSIYGTRVARLDKYMKPLNVLRDRLAKGRDGAPEIRALGLTDKETVVLDGKLDEPFWKRLPEYSLSDVVTGAKPQWGTMFRATWSGDSLYIGIVCKERDTKNLNIKTRAPRSPAVWDGDNIEILLETQTHDYYQIAVNPAGSISEADRQLGINTDWISGAQVATYIGEGYWSVEICIPVAGEAAASIDPLKGVAGKKPSATYPWYINVCRMRITADEKELTAFSPTGKTNFHDSLKFGILWSP